MACGRSIFLDAIPGLVSSRLLVFYLARLSRPLVIILYRIFLCRDGNLSRDDNNWRFCRVLSLSSHLSAHTKPQTTAALSEDL
jgi:hypothetical protein